MKTVLFFQFPWRLWRSRLAGIYRYSRKHDWRLQINEYGRTALPVAKMLAFWHPDGCIVEGGLTELDAFDAKAFGSTPVVYCDPRRDKLAGAYFGIESDSDAVARTAIRELLSLNCRHYAFLGTIQEKTWSDARRAVFQRELSASGRRFDVFHLARPGSIDEFFARIRPWLVALPKPCGILAANDTTADLCLESCRLEGIRVPDDVAVIGIDNDDLVCENCTPTLTSVVPDFERSGYLAAELLDRRMSDPSAKPDIIPFGASHIVRRHSTRRFVRRDDRVSNAVEFIRTQACSGIRAADVVHEIGGSRRAAEQRFRSLTGHSIGEELLTARIARAQELLASRACPIKLVFTKCGYANDASLRRAFKKTTGVSMHEWRARGG